MFKPVIAPPLDRSVNVGPGHFETQGHFLPGKLACPVGQKEPEALAQALLAGSPGDLLDHDATDRAVHSAHRINEGQRKFEHGRHNPDAGSRRMVIGGASSTPAATPGLGAFPWHHCYLDGVRHDRRIPDRFVNEALDRLHIVEDRFECNGLQEGLVPQPARLGQSFSLFMAASQRKYPFFDRRKGKYYIWCRGWGDSSPGPAQNKSCNFGIDWVEQSSSYRMGGGPGFPQGAWNWDNINAASSQPCYLTVATSGWHVINLWMREDGFVVDKFLLTTNATFIPSGIGPAEYLGSPPIVLSIAECQEACKSHGQARVRYSHRPT